MIGTVGNLKGVDKNLGSYCPYSLADKIQPCGEPSLKRSFGKKFLTKRLRPRFKSSWGHVILFVTLLDIHYIAQFVIRFIIQIILLII